MRQTEPRRDARTIIVMLATVVIPLAIVFWNVRSAPPWSPASDNPTPYGYTISLLLFAAPLALIAAWHVTHPDRRHHRRALSWSAGTIAAIGFLLDLAFGSDFFVFRNAGATLQIYLPGWSFTERRLIVGCLPIEEFLFYVLGGLFVAAVYSWADANWLPDYQRDDFTRRAGEQPRLIEISPKSLALWAMLVAIGFALKAAFGEGEGIPGYFLFLMVLGFLPTFLWLKSVGPFVNWRAFGFAQMSLLLVALIWEATLGVPYEWWNYQPKHLVGVRIVAWSNLPLEAILVWLIVTWDSVLVYEFCRVFLHMDRPVKRALFGVRQPGKSMDGSIQKRG